MLKKTIIKLTNPQKILLVIYGLSGGTKKMISYSDIVVGAFKQFKKEFHLAGYPRYPDSEVVGKELYRDSNKDQGLITYGNRTFALTDKGIDFVKKMKKLIEGKKIYSPNRVDAYIEKEIRRVKRLDSLRFFLEGNKDKILDIDFYSYLGVTVKTEAQDFVARLNILNEVAEILKKYSNYDYKTLYKFHNFMISKFKNEINYKISH